MLRDEVGTFVRRRPGQRCDTIVGERRCRREGHVAGGAPIVIGEVRRRAMCVATKASGRLGPLNRHQRTARRSMTRRTSSSRRVNLALVSDVRKPEQSGAVFRTPPADRSNIRSVVALAARRLGGHRRRDVSIRNTGVTTLAEWKQALVTLVRETRAGAALRAGGRREYRHGDHRLEQVPHGGIPGRPAVPGSRPTVQSRRTENRRWLQSGPAAPSVRR